MSAPTPWPPERCETLARLVAEGKSRNVIAREMGIKSDLIVGKARRMGLPAPHYDPKGRKESDVWPSERVEELKRLWGQGYSGSKIAVALDCGMTRNAIIGKVHRLKLPQRSQDARNQQARHERLAKRPRPAPKPPAPPKLVAMPLPLEPAETPLVASLTALQHHHCRYPIGDPKHEDFGFCGRPKAVGSYCAAHATVAFQAPEPGRPKNTPAQLERSIRRYADSGTVRNEAA